MNSKPISVVSLVVMLAFTEFCLQGQSNPAEGRSVFGLQEDAFAVRRENGMTGHKLQQYINERLSREGPPTAYGLCLTAELMKHAGDPRADQYYHRAIDQDPLEPAYELFYADYLRNYRGPQRPLFPEAERHYLLALRKFVARRNQLATQEYERMQDEQEELRKRIERGMIALYQRDGISLLPPRLSDPETSAASIFFSSINRYAESLTDFDEVDDVRNFTSEAAFAQSQSRLNRPLSEPELREIIRKKPQWETFDRVRFHYGNAPVIDVTYRHRELQDGQITSFNNPGEFNNVRLDEYSIMAAQTIQGEAWDRFLGAAYRRIERQGIIEFQPKATESINQFEANVGISRYVGQDKLNIEGVCVYQDINQNLPNASFRDRFIYGGTVSYQIYRKLPFLKLPGTERFETRGVSLYVGAVQDLERYDTTEVVKNDAFSGVNIKGLDRFDVTLQSSLFTSSVEGDKTQDNAQYRTDVTLLYRLQDEERTPGIPERSLFGLRPAFLHLVVPAKHDIAIQGSPSYENYRVGVGLDAKFIVRGFHRETSGSPPLPAYRGLTVLVSARYDHQWFHRLRKEVDLFYLSAGLGF